MSKEEEYSLFRDGFAAGVKEVSKSFHWVECQVLAAWKTHEKQSAKRDLEGLVKSYKLDPETCLPMLLDNKHTILFLLGILKD